MIRVVLDTNVIVSALHFPDRRLARILTLVQTGQIELAISPFILDELEGVLVRKFDWSRNRALEAKILMKSMALAVVDPAESLSVVKECEADNRVLECAVTARANFLVTGDKEHLLSLETFQDVRIVSPAEFLALFAE